MLGAIIYSDPEGRLLYHAKPACVLQDILMLYELIMLTEFGYVTLKTVFSTGDEFVSRLSEMLSCLEMLGNESQVIALSFLPHSFEEVIIVVIRKPNRQIKAA